MWTLLTMKNLILGMLTGGIWLIVPVLRIITTEYKITDERMTYKRGIINKKTDPVDWIRLKDISHSQGILGRVLGFGNIEIRSGDISHSLFILSGVPDPEKLSQEIRSSAEAIREKRGVQVREHI